MCQHIIFEIYALYKVTMKIMSLSYVKLYDKLLHVCKILCCDFLSYMFCQNTKFKLWLFVLHCICFVKMQNLNCDCLSCDFSSVTFCPVTFCPTFFLYAGTSTTMSTLGSVAITFSGGWLRPAHFSLCFQSITFSTDNRPTFSTFCYFLWTLLCYFIKIPYWIFWFHL